MNDISLDMHIIKCLLNSQTEQFDSRSDSSNTALGSVMIPVLNSPSAQENVCAFPTVLQSALFFHLSLDNCTSSPF